MKINIAETSRLRKLKKSEAEDKIQGTEYVSRLKEQYNKLLGDNDLFNWAAPKQPSEQPNAAGASANDDPILALLQSNTSVFSKNEVILKSGHLRFSKMINANYGHEHESIVSSLNFHPSENIVMTSGLDRKVKLFEVQQ